MDIENFRHLNDSALDRPAVMYDITIAGVTVKDCFEWVECLVGDLDSTHFDAIDVIRIADALGAHPDEVREGLEFDDIAKAYRSACVMNEVAKG